MARNHRSNAEIGVPLTAGSRGRNLVLRQQLAVLKHRHPQPRLTDADRFFWALLSKIWSDWRASLLIVQPETVVRWHRQGFRYYWRWKSRRRGRQLIEERSRAFDRTHRHGITRASRQGLPGRLQLSTCRTPCSVLGACCTRSAGRMIVINVRLKYTSAGADTAG